MTSRGSQRNNSKKKKRKEIIALWLKNKIKLKCPVSSAWGPSDTVRENLPCLSTTLRRWTEHSCLLTPQTTPQKPWPDANTIWDGNVAQSSVYCYLPRITLGQMYSFSIRTPSKTNSGFWIHWEMYSNTACNIKHVPNYCIRKGQRILWGFSKKEKKNNPTDGHQHSSRIPCKIIVFFWHAVMVCEWDGALAY